MTRKARIAFSQRFPRTFSVLSWVLFITVTVFVVVLAVEAIREVVDPNSEGPVGTAIATECGSQHGRLHCYGNFTSNDGQVRLHDVQIWGEDYGHVGQTYTARGNPSTGMVTVNSGEAWLSSLIGMVCFLGAWVVVFIFLIYLPIRRRRRQHRAQALSDQ